MPAVVIDTDVVSFRFKRDSRAALFQKHLLGRDWIISFMTLAELDHWALKRRWGSDRRACLERLLVSYAVQYADRLLCQLWAQVTDQAGRNGLRIEVADAWIAATALSLNAPLVTHNPTDYAGVSGLTIISESTP